jgi:ABC-type transporter Mla subunit MlaD
MHKRLSEDSGGKLDELAQAINEHLDDSEQIKEGAQAELETALENYETFLATKVGGPAARLDTLQKALPEVADILRGKPVQDAIAEPDELDHDHDH